MSSINVINHRGLLSCCRFFSSVCSALYTHYMISTHCISCTRCGWRHTFAARFVSFRGNIYVRQSSWWTEDWNGRRI